MSLDPRSLRNTAVAIGLALILAGCSDDDVVTLGNGDGSGGGAGAGDANDAIAPFAGIWDISGNWRGNSGEEALLVIRSPSDGEATALIYDLDEFNNCFDREIIDGVTTLSPVDDRVFLSDLTDFPEAVISLSNAANTLSIDFTDRNDIDGDGDREDRVVYNAPRDTAQMEADIQICTF